MKTTSLCVRQFPLIRRAGGNALLVEYEDMFPYRGTVEVASALNSLTPGDIVELQGMAKENGLEVIPLVQTFGHLEHLVRKVGERVDRTKIGHNGHNLFTLLT